MRAIGAVLSAQPERPPRRSTRRYRKGVGFVLDVSRHCTKLDRNAKARLLVACEALERATKAKGRRNGLLGYVGLQILRTLLLRFHGPSGLCCPSIETLASVTGLCRQSVINGLARLEAVGVLQITRRLQRYRDQLGNLAVRQGTNLYAFRDLSALVPLPRVYGVGGNHYSRGLRPIGRAEPAAPALHRGRDLGDLVGIMTRRLVRSQPDWRSQAKRMFASR